MTISAMKQALEALEKQHNWMVANGGAFAESSKKAIFALEKAIEQAETQEPVSALSDLRVPIGRINEIQGDLMAYYSSGAQAPKGLLFAASDCIGAILFDLIDAKRGHTAPVHAIDISQERVDETAKGKHEWAMQKMVEENERLGLYNEPVAWIKKEELAYMSAVVGLGGIAWQTNLGLKPEAGDVPLYTAPQKKEWVGLDNNIPSLGLVTEEFYNGMLCAEDILRKRNT